MAAGRLRFQKRLAVDLGPDFDCLHCRQPYYDPENAGNCAGCPRTIANETAREEADQEVRDVLGIEPEADEMLSIEGVYADVARRLAENDGRIEADWPWERGMLARSALYEETRMRLIDNWESAARARAAMARRP